MKVDKDNILSPEEEYMQLWEDYDDAGSFFAFEVHPNKFRASEIRRERILKRIRILADTFGFHYRNA